MGDDPQAIANTFAAVARDYCALIDSVSEADLHNWLADLHRVLVGLYYAGVSLPGVTPVSEVEGHRVEWQPIFTRLRDYLGEHDLYLTATGSYDDGVGIVLAHLSDDLTDTYLDVTVGIDMLDSGADPRDVISTWRIGFDLHWGRHAADAIGAIHNLRYSLWL